MSLFGSSGDGGAAALEAQRQQRINSGLQTIDQQFSGFDRPFYQKAATDYTAAQTPQMMADYQNTRNNLTYALSRGGLIKSSSALQRNQSLNRQLSSNESLIANNAQNQANQLQGNVASQKGQLISQLESSGDPTAINEQAQAATSQLRAPSAIQPLGNLFADWTGQYLAGQQANAFNQSQPNMWNQLAYSGYGNFGGGGSGGGSSVIIP